jgi:single-strand DNA-binding protein
MNSVNLTGFVANDPELRYTQSGQGILNLRIMTVKNWTDKSGVAKERKDFISVVLWGQRGEALAKVLTKDMAVAIQGELQTSTYDDKDGKKVYKTEVNASSIEQFSVSSGGSGHSGAPAFQSGNQIPFGAPAAVDYGGIDTSNIY